MDIESFDKQMRTEGWVILENMIGPEEVRRQNQDLLNAYEICRSLQIKNKVAQVTEFTVHHLIGMGDSFMDFLENLPIHEHVTRYFGGQYILNSFGGAINSAHSSSYAHNIHRDIRSFSGDLPLLLNTLIMLDDFTTENGATYLLPLSHRRAEKPSEEEFYRGAVRAVGKAGSILMFNSNLWHAGGHNQTDKARRSVTPMFCKPFVKPQYDYPRCLGYDRGNEYPPLLRQILGYNSRIPANLDEWYQPPEKRMYLPGQG